MLEKNFKRNILAFMGDAITSHIGMIIVMSYTLLMIKWAYARSVNLPEEEASNWIIPLFTIIGGLLQAIFIFLGMAFTSHLKQKKYVVGISMLISRSMFVLMAVSILFISAKWLPYTLIFLYAMYTLITYSASANWNELALKTFSVSRRGQFSHYFNFVGGIGHMIGLYIAIKIFNSEYSCEWLPLTDSKASQYVLVMGFGGIMLTLSGIFPFLIREPEYTTESRLKFREILKKNFQNMIKIIRLDKNLRNFLFFIIVFFMGFYLRGYGALYVKQNLGYTEANWGQFNQITVIIAIFSFFLWKPLGEKKNWKTVSIALGICLCLSFLSYLAASWRNPFFFVVLSHILMGLVFPAQFHIFRNLIGEISPIEDRTTYLSMVLITLSLSGILTGALALPSIDLFGLKIIFLIGAILIGLGTLRFYLRFQYNEKC